MYAMLHEWSACRSSDPRDQGDTDRVSRPHWLATDGGGSAPPRRITSRKRVAAHLLEADGRHARAGRFVVAHRPFGFSAAGGEGDLSVGTKLPPELASGLKASATGRPRRGELSERLHREVEVDAGPASCAIASPGWTMSSA
jgi:hypothetical protein